MSTPQHTSTGLNISLWIVQVLLSGTLIMAGVMKLFTAISSQAAMYPWTGEIPEAMVRLLGIVDLAGGIGILLPMAIKVKPRLTYFAAIGICTQMMAAVGFHVMRGEANLIGFNIFMLVMAAFVAWGRR